MRPKRDTMPGVTIADSIAVLSFPGNESAIDILIDAADYPAVVAAYRCMFVIKCQSGYYCSGKLRESERRARLNRWLMEQHSPNGLVVDHMNGDPVDNRRENLRVATVTVNNLNINRASSSNCGFRNVYQARKRKDYFQVKIVANGRKRYVGGFKTAIEGAWAYFDALNEIDAVAAANYAQMHRLTERPPETPKRTYSRRMRAAWLPEKEAA